MSAQGRAPGWALEWMVRAAVALLSVVVLPLGSWVALRLVTQVDRLEVEVVTLRQEAAVRQVRLDALRDELARVPTLEEIRVVIREEIDRAGLRETRAPPGR